MSASYLISVRGRPPYKQAPASRDEKGRQLMYVEALKKEACRIVSEKLSGPVRVVIRYRRCCGRADPANIVGGVLDALKGIAYDDDKDVVEIHYYEEKGEVDEYRVEVSSVNSRF